MASFDRQQRGSSMIEVLVTMIVLSLGLLGLMQLMMRASMAEYESYQRAQALILLSDMVEKINSNRKAAGCYAFSDATSGAPYLGTSSSGPTPCTAWGTAAQQARALVDLNDWHQKLLGTGESKSGAAAGAMLGARGCVTFDPTSNIYQVSVAWQGTTNTIRPTSVDATLVCGTGLYGPEEQRRIVAATLTVASLR
jgi:type IV pilus assembly protein PilV